MPPATRQHLDSVGVSFDDAGTPRQGEAGDDGVEPLRKPFALTFGEHLSEGPDVTGKGVKFGAVDQDCLELESFAFGEGFRAAENPSMSPSIESPEGRRLRSPASPPRHRTAFGRLALASTDDLGVIEGMRPARSSLSWVVRPSTSRSAGGG